MVEFGPVLLGSEGLVDVGYGQEGCLILAFYLTQQTYFLLYHYLLPHYLLHSKHEIPLYISQMLSTECDLLNEILNFLFVLREELKYEGEMLSVLSNALFDGFVDGNSLLM